MAAQRLTSNDSLLCKREQKRIVGGGASFTETEIQSKFKMAGFVPILISNGTARSFSISEGYHDPCCGLVEALPLQLHRRHLHLKLQWLESVKCPSFVASVVWISFPRPVFQSQNLLFEVSEFMKRLCVKKEKLVFYTALYVYMFCAFHWDTLPNMGTFL